MQRSGYGLDSVLPRLQLCVAGHVGWPTTAFATLLLHLSTPHSASNQCAVQRSSRLRPNPEERVQQLRAVQGWLHPRQDTTQVHSLHRRAARCCVCRLQQPRHQLPVQNMCERLEAGKGRMSCAVPSHPQLRHILSDRLQVHDVQAVLPPLRRRPVLHGEWLGQKW